MKKFLISGFALIQAFMLTVVLVNATIIGQYIFDQAGGLVTSVQSSYDNDYYQIQYDQDNTYEVINDVKLMTEDINGNYYFLDLKAGQSITFYNSYPGYVDLTTVNIEITVKAEIYVQASRSDTLYDYIYGFYSDTFYASSSLETPDNILQIMTVSTMFLIALVPVFLVAGVVKKLWS